MLIDVATGVLKAVKNKDLNSTKAREGIYKKASFILFIAFGYLSEYAMQFVDLGFTFPAGGTVCLLVIVLNILMCIGLAKSFGKGGGFACGLIFLAPIFYCIMAFSNDIVYLGPGGPQQAAPGAGYGYGPNGGQVPSTELVVFLTVAAALGAWSELVLYQLISA